MTPGRCGWDSSACPSGSPHCYSCRPTRSLPSSDRTTSCRVARFATYATPCMLASLLGYLEASSGMTRRAAVASSA